MIYLLSIEYNSVRYEHLFFLEKNTYLHVRDGKFRILNVSEHNMRVKSETPHKYELPSTLLVYKETEYSVKKIITEEIPKILEKIIFEKL